MGMVIALRYRRLVGHFIWRIYDCKTLSHTDLFAAGNCTKRSILIRTAAPHLAFKRGSEPIGKLLEVYFNMSPFSFAHKVKNPILMIHGEADNNSGLSRSNQRRYYNAFEGVNGAYSLDCFPTNESHGLWLLKSLLHTLLGNGLPGLEKYVKNKNVIDKSK